MKLVGRTVAIVLAALLVCGATYALGTAGLLGSGRGEFRERQRAGQTNATGTQLETQAQPPQGQFPEGFEGRGRGGREGGGLFGLFEVGKSLAIVALIVAVVASAQSMIRRRWPKRGARLRESRL